MTLARKKEIGVVVFISIYTGIVFALFALMMAQGQGQLTPFTTGLFVVLALLWVALVQFSQAINPVRAGPSVYLVLIIPLLIVGIGRLSVPSMVGALLAGLLLLIGRSYAYKELSNRIYFKIGQIFKISTRYTLLALAFGLISISMPSFEEKLAPENVQIPAKYLTNWVDATAPIVSRIIPGYDPSKTVDEFVAEQVQSQIGEGETLPEGQLDLARRQLAEQFGLELSGGEKLSDLTSGIVNKYLQNWAQYNQVLFIGIIIILLFLVWRALTPFLIWPTLWTLMFLIFFATRIGLVYSVKTAATVERLQL